ncbi:hypothetical protein [Parabacteroides distasonis]|uniref:hypothetical protein n=1 Tax=Parabacteroides distasonis TaxID=823 RepID=UPI003F24ED12
MKTNLFIAALSLVVLAGCSSEDEVGTLVAKSDNAITFGTYVGKQTKASIMDDTQLQSTGFNVIATYTSEKDWATAGATTAPNFMYDQAVTYADSKWSYTPIQYWPNEQNETGDLGKVTFFAYSPKTTGITTISEKSAKGAPTIKLTVSDDIDKQIDLVADMVTDLTKTNTTIDGVTVNAGTVKFKMDHLLSQIKFQAKLKEQYTGATSITVTGFKLSFVTNKIKNAGTYTFNTDNTTTSIWKLGDTFHNVAIEETNLTKALDNTATLVATDLLDPMFLLPQTYTTGDITAVISYTVTTTAGEVNNVKKIDLPVVTGGWIPSKKYLYTFEIELQDVTVGVESADWSDGNME